MNISLTPHELLDLLDPWIARQRFRGEPLNLDALTPNEFAGELRDRLRAADAEDAVAQGARAAEDLMLADLRQTKEELNRATVMLEERKQELEQIIKATAKLKARPAWQAEQVIIRAGAQVLDLATIFLLEDGSADWYEGIRTTLRELVSTLGVEVENEALEQALKTLEPPLVEQTPAPFVPPAGFKDLELGDRPVAGAHGDPALADVGDTEAASDERARVVEIMGAGDYRAEDF